ncbi:MAG: hypothetical protein NC409_07550 [Clostridium sp.]|nr:hypothetical protein [Clostridium sp.]
MEIELQNDYIVGMFGSITYERQKRSAERQERLLAQGTAQESPEEAERKKELAEKLKGVTVTISPESAALWEKLQEEKRAERAAAETRGGEVREEGVFDREDPFAPQEQWEMQYTVFTKALSEMGFYDGMSDEEVLKTEKLLVDMTHTMNQLCGYFKCESMDGEKISVSSFAAKMELESSTAALRRFADQCLPQEMRARFDKLTDRYYAYNAEKLKGYRSVEERADQAMAEILDRTASSPDRARPVSEYERIRWTAGSVTAGKEEEERAVAAWRDCFRRFACGKNDSSRLSQTMNEILLRYASGGSNDQKLLAYLDAWNRPIVEHAKSYWSALSNL